MLYVLVLPVQAQTPQGALCVVWSQSEGTSLNDEGWDVAVDEEGTVYLTGIKTVAGNNDVLLCRFSPDGQDKLCINWGGQLSQKGFAIGFSLYYRRFSK
ncbi:hypothetical protein ACFL27_06600 [candidate division CSSED10-310 bacterium]|uniref:Uncharacterized protein n=1 Tax=candidate division CSSED10-310 bacterium TaxID=2855610 RepID=A0ABV6YUI0_UNCC1